MYQRWFFRQLRCDQRGSIAVETAIALPVLLLMLFGGADITRYIQAMHRLDAATALIADGIGNRAVIDGALIEQVKRAALGVVAFNNNPAHLDIVVGAGRLWSGGQYQEMWTISSADAAANCRLAPQSYGYENPESDPYFPSQYLFDIQVCSYLEDSFFLSALIPKSLRRIRLGTVRAAPALLGPENG